MDEPRVPDLEHTDEQPARQFLAKPMSDPGAEDEVDYEERIRRLELEARPLDPSAEERILLRDKVVVTLTPFWRVSPTGRSSSRPMARITPCTTPRSRRNRRTQTRP